MNKGKILSGVLLILAAIGFWASLFLMPDPGTTDTIFILRAASEARLRAFFAF